MKSASARSSATPDEIVLSLPAAGVSDELPALFQAAPDAGRRFLEFFTVNIRNAHTRRAYFKAVETFAAWCGRRALHTLPAVTPMHVALYVEQLGRSHSKPTVKQHLAAIRMLFDWLVTGQVVPSNPAHAVRGPKHSVKKGKTSVLDAGEMRDLLGSIDTVSLIGLRDRALIALMGYTFARVSGAVGMRVEDFYIQNRRGWVRLPENGGRVTELPCHHNLDQYLEEGIAAADLAKTPDAPLFPTLRHGRLAETLRPLPQANVHAMIQWRARRRHPHENRRAQFPGDGHHELLQNGGKLEVAQAMAGHESARTTGLYDRRNDAIALDEVERIAF
jgi:integrase/recombinase XerD